MVVLGSLGYELVAGHGQMPDAISINIVLTLVLALALAAVHEGIHGIAMIAFGAKPSFGILRDGRVPAGFYATSPGHRFRRWPYLVVALAPTVILAPLGIPLCWSALGSSLWMPFGAHLGGCVGDLTIVLIVLQTRGDILVEDLRDGMRIWKTASVG